MDKSVENCGGIELPKTLDLIEEDAKNGEKVSKQLQRNEGDNVAKGLSGGKRYTSTRENVA